MPDNDGATFEKEDYTGFSPPNELTNGSTNHTVNIDHVTLSDGQSDEQKEQSGSTAGGATDEDVDLRCGIGSCKPRCLQAFNNPKVVLIWLCWFAFLQGFMINGINNVNTATLERRFELTSSKAGLISSSYDISAAIFVIPISYYGAHAHQPRMLTIASLFMACGAFVNVIPHFATGLYDLQESQADQCVIGSNSTAYCVGSESNLSLWLGVFMLGMFLIGIGGTTLYSVGIVFLDSSVSTRTSPLYQGILTCSSTLGPALGYILGGYFLQTFYVDMDKVDINSMTDLTSSDPRFVGAWWLGFLGSGVLLVTVMLLLMGYPRELPGAKEARMRYTTEVHQSSTNQMALEEGFGRRWKDMPAALKVLFTNPVYICNCLASVADLLMVSGFATFITKLLRNQFNLSAGTASTYAGAVSVLGAASGQIGGAFICKFAKLDIRGMLRMNIGISVAVAVTCSAFFLRCSSPEFAGVNRAYANPDLILSNVDLESTCNAECGCTTLSYEPICDTNQIQYFSPCHAGCQTLYHSNNTKAFVNCSCTNQSADEFSGSMATEGGCDVDCNYLNGFLVLLFAAILMLFLTAVPILTITLRCIPESQRSFGIGIQWLLIRILGTMPGPIMMGAVFDVTCLVWQETCDGRGSCWIYDSKQLSIRIFIMGVVIKSVSATLFTMALCFYKPPPKEKTDKDVSLSDNTDNKTDSHEQCMDTELNCETRPV